MNKEKISRLCNFLSIALVIIFAVKNIADYIVYSNTLNSAPFWVCILVNSLYCLIPAAILFLIGFLIKKKRN